VVRGRIAHKDLPSKTATASSAPGAAPKGQSEVLSEEDLLREVLGAFLPDISNHLTDLNRCLSDQDRESLQRGAHTLKSLCATFGMTVAAESAQKLELACRNDSNWEELRIMTCDLIDRIESSRPALEKIIADDDQP